MTGRMVERAAPAAYRSAPVPPIGVSPLMPPHSQGAERRQEHRAGRTGSRWSLRVLVIGGLAGAAWLLTGAAAQAADRDPAGGGLSLGSSLIGAVVHGDDHSAPVVGRVLMAAVQPLAPERHRGSGSAVAAPDKAAHSSSDADSALGGVVGVVRGSTAPLHLSGDAVDTRKRVPASGPGTATEGGAAAFLPAKVTDSTVACHRLPIATEVGVRRHDAEAPTVSPD